MNSIKTIILEDEHKPREALKLKLEKHHPEIEIAALCESYTEATEKILSVKPDLLFLDINMPGKSGLELLQLLRDARLNTKIIITTAYPNQEYYRKAIHLSVIDYLLKPVDKDELQEAIEKVKQRMSEELRITDAERLSVLYSKPKQFEFACAVGKLFAHEEQIVYIKAEGNYSRIFLSDSKNELITESMKQLEEKLGATMITRVDRSHFINKAYVQKVVTASNRCYFISAVNLAPIELNETGIKNLMR